MARHNSLGAPSVEGFTGSDESLNPGLLAVLCCAGMQIYDLNVTHVVGTKRAAVKDFIEGVVSMLATIETAPEKDGIPAEDEATSAAHRDDALCIVHDGFRILDQSSTRAVAIDVPYTDIRGTGNVLVAVLTRGAHGAVSAGLYTEVTSPRSR